MKRSISLDIELFDILKNGGMWQKNELAKQLDILPYRISTLVRKLRERFLEGDKGIKNYIYTTKDGYTIDEHKEHVIHESGLRMKLGTSVLLGGRYVFKRFKQIEKKGFHTLMVEYKPKMSEVNSMIKPK